MSQPSEPEVTDVLLNVPEKDDIRLDAKQSNYPGPALDPGNDCFRTCQYNCQSFNNLGYFFPDHSSNKTFMAQRVLANYGTSNTSDKGKETAFDVPKGERNGTVFPGKIDQDIIQELEKEINDICEMLGIAEDPMKWSTESCKKWLHWHIGKIHASQLYQGDFKITGADLCKLSLNEFRYLFYPLGDTLHAQLDVWKRAKEFLCNTNRRKIVSNKDLGRFGKHTDCIESATLNSGVKKYCSNEGTLNDGHLRKGVRQTIHLWEFLKELLKQPSMYSSCITWLDKEKGIFKIENSSRVASLWGRRKNRPAMNFDKLSRSIRQYYKKNIIKKTEKSKRLVYQFCQHVL